MDGVYFRAALMRGLAMQSALARGTFPGTIWHRGCKSAFAIQPALLHDADSPWEQSVRAAASQRRMRQENKPNPNPQAQSRDQQTRDWEEDALVVGYGFGGAVCYTACS